MAEALNRSKIFYVTFILIQNHFYLFTINEISVFFNTFRHALAAMHFNENIQREIKRTTDGELSYNVLYPKFKLGEEVVPVVAIPPTYSKALLYLLL